MKIKNKLLSIFGILLFSCHPVSPVYADDVTVQVQECKAC